VDLNLEAKTGFSPGLSSAIVSYTVLLPTRSFTGLFVNTHGQIDTPADLQMEYLVKNVKKQIKHMYSNKTEGNIVTRTSVLSAMNEISS
jgi:hypothetical protein